MQRKKAWNENNFHGHAGFSAVNLEYLHKAGHEIIAVVSQPDKPVGRHGEPKPTAVKEKAIELGITNILQPVNPSDPAFTERIRELQPDVIIVTAYGRILKKAILDIPKYGCINVHASLLPRWRGAAPIQWAVIEGDKETGVTAMQMNEGLDTGDILAVKKLAIAPDETGGSLFDKLAVLGGELICETLSMIKRGELHPIPQSDDGACYAKQLTKAMGNIDWTKDAESIERLIRGLYPWPGTYTYYKGHMIKLHRAALADADTFGNKAVPSSVMTRDGRIYAACGAGAIEILELQPESRKRMSANDYLRGNTLDGGFGRE